jgi:hypothetical protein
VNLHAYTNQLRLRPGDVFRNGGRLWIVDRTSECGARARVLVGDQVEVVDRWGDRHTFTGGTDKYIHVSLYSDPGLIAERRGAAGLAEFLSAKASRRRVSGKESGASTTTEPADGGQEGTDSMAKKAKEAKKEDAAPYAGSLGGVFGHAVTAVIRALAKAGASNGHIRAIMAAQKVKVADGTVNIQATAGRNGRSAGKDGKPVTYAELTQAQTKELLGSAEDPAEVAKAEKAAAEKAEKK